MTRGHIINTRATAGSQVAAARDLMLSRRALSRRLLIDAESLAFVEALYDLALLAFGWAWAAEQRDRVEGHPSATLLTEVT